MLRVVRLAVVLAAATPVAAAHAQDTLTPEGPATVREHWTGGVTAEGRPPQVVTGWSVTVGPGGQAGPVRLRVFKGADVIGSGATEWLPAAPGTYRFTLPIGIPYDTRYFGMALDQEVGRHAIIGTPVARPELGQHADPSQLHHVQVYRPRVSEDAVGATPAETLNGKQLFITPTVETDLDGDLLGDQSMDVLLRLVKTEGPTPRVVLGVGRAGTARLVARIAGLKIVRTIVFAKADRRVVRLLPASKADRRRLARALRRPGRLTGTVTVTMGRGEARLTDTW